MCDEEKRKEVIEQIKKAFTDTPPPKGWKIGYDWNDPEDDNMEVAFKKYAHWQELPFEIIFQYRNELFYLTDEGFHFYLPAFMVAILKRGHDTDTLVDTILDRLVPPSLYYPNSYEEKDEASYEKRAKLFTLDECKAIFSFLKCYKAMFYDEFTGPSAYQQDLTESALVYWFLLAEDKD